MEYTSSLNNDVVPDPDFLNSIEGYFPKFSPEIIKMIADKAGLNTSDERVYTVFSIAVEIFLNKLFNEIYDVDNRNKKDLKTHLIFNELAMVLKDFEIDANCVNKFTENRGSNKEM